jgi:hypothetical protein
VNQNLTQVNIAALADAQQLGLASSRVLSWHKPEPRRKVSSLAERRTVADSGNDGCCDDRSDAEDLSDTAATCVARSDLFEPIGQLFDLLFDGLPPSRSILIRFRIIGVSALSAFSRTSAIAALSLAGFCANTMPRSSRNARIWLMAALRRATSRSRIRCIACRSS